MRFFALFLFFLLGCDQPAAQAVSFEWSDITIERAEAAPLVLSVELADTPERQARGLMYRTTLGATQGMLFDFHKPRFIHMWMANTPLSLDMIFIDNDGVITEIVTNTPPFSRERISSTYKTRAVLELNADTAEKFGIKIGDKVLFKLATE